MFRNISDVAVKRGPWIHGLVALGEAFLVSSVANFVTQKRKALSFSFFAVYLWKRKLRVRFRLDIKVIALVLAVHGGTALVVGQWRRPELSGALYAALLEESIFRGVLLQKLLATMGPDIAVTVQALLFGTFFLSQ